MEPDSTFSGYDFVPPEHAGPTGVFIVCVLLLGVFVAGGIGYLFWVARALHHARLRERTLLDERSRLPLSAGPLRVVHGRVERERDEADDVVAEVDVTQLVEDKTSKNTHWHIWKEIDRESRARPFYLVHDGDERVVYVEAADDVLIVDTLGTSYPDDLPQQRVRAAKVKHGETIYAYGDLFTGQHARAGGAAYRDGSLGFILRPPRTGRLLLATDAMRDRYDKRVSFLLIAASIVTAAWLAFHAAFTVPTLVASFFGTASTTRVTWASTYVVRGKNGSTTYYSLHTETDDGIQLVADVPYQTWYAVKTAQTPRNTVHVPLLRVGDSEYASFIGRRPHASMGAMVAGVIFALIAFGVIAGVYTGRRAWYDRKKLVEHGGSGHWVETRPHVPITSDRN
jgi:hypothetical protein